MRHWENMNCSEIQWHLHVRSKTTHQKPNLTTFKGKCFEGFGVPGSRRKAGSCNFASGFAGLVTPCSAASLGGHRRFLNL
eukprot:1849592-Amphidinium_carterae.1